MELFHVSDFTKLGCFSSNCILCCVQYWINRDSWFPGTLLASVCIALGVHGSSIACVSWKDILHPTLVLWCRTPMKSFCNYLRTIMIIFELRPHIRCTWDLSLPIQIIFLQDNSSENRKLFVTIQSPIVLLRYTVQFWIDTGAQ